MIFITPILILLLFGIYSSVRWAWWRPTISYASPRILMYHMITQAQPHHKFRGLRVAPEAFEQQLKWLRKNDWTFITMSELYDNIKQSKRVAITFDDGFSDNYTHAFPLLKKYNAKATLYLVADRHQRDWSMNKKKHHSSGELATEPKLTDEQVREMLESGIFELGGHTTTHCKLTDLSTKEKRVEIIESKAEQESLFKTTLTSFAYPFGIFDQTDVEMVDQAGYRTAVTVDDGTANLKTPFRLPRVKVSGKEGLFSFKLRIRTGKRKL